MIRLFIRTMHNRLNPAAESRDVTRGELGVLAPLVAAIVALGIYPQLVLHRTEDATVGKVREAAQIASPAPAQAGHAERTEHGP